MVDGSSPYICSENVEGRDVMKIKEAKKRVRSYSLVRGRLNERVNGEIKERKKQGVGLQPSYPEPFGSLLRPAGIIR